MDNCKIIEEIKEIEEQIFILRKRKFELEMQLQNNYSKNASNKIETNNPYDAIWNW